MYNIFDFEGNAEVSSFPESFFKKKSTQIPLPRCDFGCLIFASTNGKFRVGKNKIILIVEHIEGQGRRGSV